jgi:hypothetical protein
VQSLRYALGHLDYGDRGLLDPARIQQHQVAAVVHRIVSEGRQVTIVLGTTARLWHEGSLTNDLVAQVMARDRPVSVSSLSTVLNTAGGGLTSLSEEVKVGM